MHNICGIILCGQPIQFPGAVTCNDPSHIDWHKKWMNCFKWLSYLGVQQVIHCQNTDTEELLDVNVNVNAGGNGNHGGNANVLHCASNCPCCRTYLGIMLCIHSMLAPHTASKPFSGLAELQLVGENVINLKAHHRF